MRSSVLALLLLAGLATALPAAVIFVPGHHATIAQALAAAKTGDTILVAPGTYKENITWPAVDGIRLVGVAGFGQTILDGNQAGRTLEFGSGLTRATVMEGFTITGGFLNGTRNYGAGIYISGGSPTLRFNHITANVGDGPNWNYGGGVYVGSSSSALIERNVISLNILKNGSWNYGAGIYVYSGATPDIVANQILENENLSGSRGYGGGVFVGSSSPCRIVGNVIARNLCQAGSYNYGAGLRVYSSSAALILNNTFAENKCIGGNWAYGGGIEYSGTAAGQIENNIIASNQAGTGGGIYMGSSTAPSCDYNNVWNNTGGNYSGISAGPNSISLDPLFFGSKNYHLTFRSPCVDAGSPAVPGTVAVMDLDGDSRRLDGDLDGLKGDGARVDMGADEYAVGQLQVSGPPQIGTSVTFTVNGPTGAAWSLLYSPYPGQLFVNPYGYVLIGAPFGLLTSGAVPGQLPFPIPSASSLIGVTVYVQGVVGLLQSGQAVGNVTNRLDLTFF